MNCSSGLVAALVLIASGAVFAQSPAPAVPKEFKHVRTMGRALSELNDGRIQVVAAYYYSQSNHDSRWSSWVLSRHERRKSRASRSS
jgi:hypothetical protein